MDQALKIDRIKAQFERDLVEKPPALTLSDIPAFYECITTEWLTHVVQRRYPGAQVAGFRLHEPDSGTSNRRRITLSYDACNSEKGFPGSIFCKASHDLLNRILMSSASAHSEVTFYNEIRNDLDIDAPDAFFAAVDRTSYRSIVVLEDLAGMVEFCRHDTAMSLERVRSQLSLLAQMHGRFYESPDLESRIGSIYPFASRFMNLVEHHDLAKACDDGLMAAADVIPASVLARRSEIWPLTLRSVERLAMLPQTLNHGDVHLKNWYVRGTGQMGLSDFQCLNRGHWSRDVAYAIVTALAVEDRRRWERELLAFYLERLRETCGSTETFDESWTNYRQQMFSVLAWWTVTMSPSSSMPDMQPQDTTLAFLERIGQAMEDLASLDSF